MSQNSGPFLPSSYGHPSFNPRLPSSSLSPSLKRQGNGPMSIGNLPNTSLGPNMNVTPSPPMMRPSNSMAPMKPGTVGMNPMDKSNSMPYTSRYTRKVWPMARSFHDKGIRGHDDHESPYLRPGLPNHGVPSDSMSGSSFTIEPATDDDETDDIYFSTRHMAGARFQRNQRLVAEIFNEVCIPDLRSNVSVDRILQLRRQVDALKTHRDTFEKDLNELEEKHIEKKRKFVEANEKFHSEYTEASATNLSQEKISEILQKYETMEKLQKERQLLLQQQQQQQQAAVIPPSSQPSSSTTTTTTTTAITTTTVSEPIVPPAMKTEPEPTVEVPQQQVSTPPPPTGHTPLPPPPPPPQQQQQQQTVPAPVLPSQPVASPLAPPQPIPPQMPPTQPVHSQIPPPHPVQPQVPTSMPPPPAMQQMPPQQPQMAQAPQGYPMMHSGGGYAPTAGYGHPQQTQYRPAMNQRPVQYPSNAQWQQQQQQQQQQQPQQQWQTNTYDPRYYNTYPSNVQWQQQPQQWPTNQPQQQMGAVSHSQQTQMRGPPQQQQHQAAMYANNAHYGYGGTTAGWNTGAHPSQSYGYPQNPSYDPSLVSTPQQQQQYYSQSQMHNPPQGYEYAPPPQQQPPPPPQMN